MFLNKKSSVPNFVQLYILDKRKGLINSNLLTVLKVRRSTCQHQAIKKKLSDTREVKSEHIFPNDGPSSLPVTFNRKKTQVLEVLLCSQNGITENMLFFHATVQDFLLHFSNKRIVKSSRQKPAKAFIAELLFTSR